jgi:hypothetical protein
MDMLYAPCDLSKNTIQNGEGVRRDLAREREGHYSVSHVCDDDRRPGKPCSKEDGALVLSQGQGSPVPLKGNDGR